MLKERRRGRGREGRGARSGRVHLGRCGEGMRVEEGREGEKRTYNADGCGRYVVGIYMSSKKPTDTVGSIVDMMTFKVFISK